MTEMGYLQCFLTPSLISTIAHNTNLYAASKHAPAGWATSAEEVWLFIAVHIYMGIVDLRWCSNDEFIQSTCGP
jgi:predicted acetyltransferase